MPKALEREVRIVRDENMGRAAKIAGTRIRVMDIVEKHIVLGNSPEDIAKSFGISISVVYNALSYYYEHPEEIRGDIKKHEELVEKFRKELA